MPDRGAPRFGEEALLADLASALAPDDVLPPATTVQALRSAVADMTPAVARRRPAAGWVRHRWAVAGGAVALLTLGTGTAFAAGVPVPPAMRILATDIGLPVTPQPVVDVRNATSSLQQTLRSARADPAGTAANARRLAQLIHDLPPSQRAEVPVIAPRLLHQACRQLFPYQGAPTVGQGGRGMPTGWPGCPGTSPGQSVPSRAAGEPVPITRPGRPTVGSDPVRSGTPIARPGGGEPGRPSGSGTHPSSGTHPTSGAYPTSGTYPASGGSPRGNGTRATTPTRPVTGPGLGSHESLNHFRTGTGGSHH